MALIKEQKIRVLAITAKKRVQFAPEIPTLAENGVPGYEASAWQMFAAPAKTPKEIVGRLNAEYRDIVSDAAVKREIDGRGHIAIVTPPPEYLAAVNGSRSISTGPTFDGLLPLRISTIVGRAAEG